MFSKTQGEKKLISGTTSLSRTEFPNPQYKCIPIILWPASFRCWEISTFLIHIWLPAIEIPINCNGNMLMLIHIRWSSWVFLETYRWEYCTKHRNTKLDTKNIFYSPYCTYFDKGCVSQYMFLFVNIFVCLVYQTFTWDSYTYSASSLQCKSNYI